jgi:hypothetical protein
MSREVDNSLLDYEKVHEECIIRFGEFNIYKKYDCNPLYMQGLFKKFFHWIGDDEGIMAGKYPTGYLVCAFIFFSKRISEDKTKHLQSDWLLNKVMTQNMMLLDNHDYVASKGSKGKLRYDINLEALTMHVDDTAMKQEATIQVGSINPDDTTYGDKVSRFSR